jgi:hypothetical protein
VIKDHDDFIAELLAEMDSEDNSDSDSAAGDTEGDPEEVPEGDAPQEQAPQWVPELEEVPQEEEPH